MILVDSSAWVEFDRATGSPLEERLTDLMHNGGEIAVTEPVLMEVLAGARDQAAAALLRRMLTGFSWIPAEAAVDFEAAAQVYRSCRMAGVTPGGLVDCMIAAIALRSGASLLTGDAGFHHIARVVPLRLEPVSG